MMWCWWYHFDGIDVGGAGDVVVHCGRGVYVCSGVCCVFGMIGCGVGVVDVVDTGDDVGDIGDYVVTCALAGLRLVLMIVVLWYIPLCDIVSAVMLLV